MANEAEVALARERLRFDTPFWAEHCAKVLDAEKQLVPLRPFPWQEEFDAKLEAQRAAGLPMRAIILKSRKLGFSTWVAAKFLQRLTQLPNQHAIICAQDVDTAGEIFNIAKRIYSHLPHEHELGLGFNIRPDLTGASFSPNGRKYMSFGERSRRLRELGRSDESVLEIDTANAPEAGRGMTPNLVHLSEVGRWLARATSGPTSKMAALLDAVPYVPETIVILESTAGGLNHFYHRWNLAVEGREDPDTGEAYVTHFVPWWRDHRCQQRFPGEEARQRFIDGIGMKARFGEMAEDEPMLVEMYGCTPEQLQWRRMKIREKQNDVEVFKQEFPASPEEAFIGSGRTVFPGILIGRAIKEADAAPEPVRGTLRASGWHERRTRGGTIMVPTGTVWVPEDKAARDEPLLDVWEHPITKESLEELPVSERGPEGAYVVGVDVAEGEANTFTSGDFHAIGVWDHRSRAQVAQYESRIDIHKLPLWIVLVALYFNRAWLGVEVNGPGIAVIEPIQKDYRYPRCFRRRRFDSTRNVEVDLMGWKTDKVTKPQMEAGFGEALDDGTHGIRSARLARQLNTYVIDDRGRHGAQDGEHDDLLMMAMIAHRIMDLLRPPREKGSRSVRGHTVTDDLTGY